MDPQDPADAYRVEPAVVDEAPDRLRMHAQLIRDFADAHEPFRFTAERRDDTRTFAGLDAGR